MTTTDAIDTQIREAEQSGDYATARQLKAEKLARVRREEQKKGQ